MRALYVTHPQVQIDANVPVPLWGLSAEGRLRAEAFARRGVVPPDAALLSSRETKAKQLADILAGPIGAVADRFFGEPKVSAQGWERAIDAQARIVAVGTLLKCHVGGRAISRGEDQSRHAHRGGGNCFAFDLDAMALGGEWVSMEDFAPGWFD